MYKNALRKLAETTAIAAEVETQYRRAVVLIKKNIAEATTEQERASLQMYLGSVMRSAAREGICKFLNGGE